MMLTTKGRYAVMAMVDLAYHSEGKPTSLAQISDRQDITLPYLEQIFAKLKKAELVKSVRGPGGGYLLNNSADKILVADIIQAVDEVIKMTSCKSLEACIKQGKKSSKCMTHNLWSGLSKQILTYLSAITLNDICAGNDFNNINFKQVV